MAKDQVDRILSAAAPDPDPKRDAVARAAVAAQYELGRFRKEDMLDQVAAQTEASGLIDRYVEQAQDRGEAVHSEVARYLKMRDRRG